MYTGNVGFSPIQSIPSTKSLSSIRKSLQECPSVSSDHNPSPKTAYQRTLDKRTLDLIQAFLHPVQRDARYNMSRLHLWYIILPIAKSLVT